jgi:Zn-dependent M28 family amino/carboxypeptidase
MVVVGAHHDHLGRGEFGSMATAEEAGKVHPGADDNASGVAGVLALARRWQQRPAGKRTIVFAAFGAEEFGQLGSHRWLASGAPATRSIVAMIDLDMIGRGRSGRLSVYGSDSGAGFRALLEQQQKALGLAAQLRDRSSYRSDQNEFLACGIPALLFTTGVHDQYHRPGDVPGLVEVTAAVRIVDLVDQMLQNLVDGAERPLFVPPQQKR